VNKELKMIWIEAVMASFEGISNNFLEGPRKTVKNLGQEAEMLLT
jgi:hypothetical protein